MAIHTEWVSYAGGAHAGLLCHPERARLPLPGLVVIQEIWGVDAHIEDVTRRLAGAGYAAFAPDLYAPSGERKPALTRERISEARTILDAIPPASWGDLGARDAAIATRTEPERARINETINTAFGGLHLPAYVPQLLATTRYLREECPATRGQKLGSIGFCMGGGISALLACHDPALSAAVMFYGMAPPAELIADIQCPVLAFYGEADVRYTATAAPFAEAMQKAGKRFEHHIYPDTGHAFFNDGRASYQAQSARDAFARTVQFFRSVL